MRRKKKPNFLFFSSLKSNFFLLFEMERKSISNEENKCGRKK
jgi:hypothetical protein